MNTMTIALVTEQFHCEKIIDAASRLAEKTGTSLEVISIVSDEYPRNPQAMERLFEVCREHGAVMTIEYNPEPSRVLGRMIDEKQPQNVVSGMPGKDNSILHRLWVRFRQIHFYTVDAQNNLKMVTPLEFIA